MYGVVACFVRDMLRQLLGEMAAAKICPSVPLNIGFLLNETLGFVGMRGITKDQMSAMFVDASLDRVPELKEIPLPELNVYGARFAVLMATKV